MGAYWPAPVAMVTLSGIAWIVMLAVRGRILRRRRESIQQYASRNGYEFSAEDRYRLTETGLPLLRRGSKRKCGNVVSGRVGGFPFVAADYVYDEDEMDIRGGSRGYGHRYKCFALAVVALDPGLRLPTMVISRRVVPVPLGQHAGLREVWTGNEPFDRRIRVEVAGGTRVAGHLVNPGMMRHLLDTPAASPVFRWELSGSRLLVATAPRPGYDLQYQSTEDMLMEHIEPLLDAAAGFAQRVAAVTPPVAGYQR